jgi:hypothetical protein
MANHCDITVCRTFGQCEIDPSWCKVWRYVHNRDHSPACSSYLREKIASQYITVDTHGRVFVTLPKGTTACDGVVCV